MKITSKILSIPPYILVAWKDISSLHTKVDQAGEPILVITLHNLTQVEVPHIEPSSVKEIFEAFSRFHDQEKSQENHKKPLEGSFQFALPLKSTEGIDPLISSVTHNPQQADLPNLPPEMLEKITQIAKIFGLEDTNLLPKPEPHCNCLHCQVVRSLQNEPPLSVSFPIEQEEEVSEKELTFRQWDIQQAKENKNLYIVKNPLDITEEFHVFLGDPLGCTCGQKNCEHLRAVLSS